MNASYALFDNQNPRREVGLNDVGINKKFSVLHQFLRPFI